MGGKIIMEYINQREYGNDFKRMCGLTCALMIIRDAGHTISPQELLEDKALSKKDWAFDKGDITHRALVRLLNNYGVPAFAEEFRVTLAEREKENKKLCAYGIEKIKKHIKNGGSVIASVVRQSKNGKSGHLILLIGYVDNNFIIHDPDYEIQEGFLKMPTEVFIEKWRQLAIFVR